MFEVYRWQVGDILAFALIILRVSACVVTMPILGTKLIPSPVKALISILFTLCLFPALRHQVPNTLDWESTTVVFAMREVALGIFLGFLTRLMFTAVDIAGQVISFATGMNTAAIINPTFGESVSSLEQFQSNLVMLLFLAINGHYFFIEALASSFTLAPVGVLAFNPMTIMSVNKIVQEILVVGIQLAGPLLAITLVLNLAQGIVGRVVPQINVFITSLQVNVMVGLFVFCATIPFLMSAVEVGFGDMAEKIMGVIKQF